MMRKWFDDVEQHMSRPKIQQPGGRGARFYYMYDCYEPDWGLKQMKMIGAGKYGYIVVHTHVTHVMTE